MAGYSRVSVFTVRLVLLGSSHFGVFYRVITFLLNYQT